MAENPFNKMIKILQCEGGGEYKYFQNLAKDSGNVLSIHICTKYKDWEKTQIQSGIGINNASTS